MKTLAIQQNSEEWHEFRKGRSGGSEFRNLWISGLPTKEKIIAKLEEHSPLPPADKKLKVAELAAMLEPAELAELKLDSEPKMAFYEMVAERVARPITPNDYADRLNGRTFTMMERGHILEPEALEVFTAKTGKLIHPQSCIWIKDNNDKIYVSPDGPICAEKELGKDITLLSPVEAVEVKCLESAKIIKAYHEKRYPEEYEPQVLKYFIVNEKLETLYFVLYTDVIPGLELQIFEIHRKDVADRLADAEAFENAIMERVDRLANEIEELGF